MQEGMYTVIIVGMIIIGIVIGFIIEGHYKLNNTLLEECMKTCAFTLENDADESACFDSCFALENKDKTKRELMGCD